MGKITMYGKKKIRFYSILWAVNYIVCLLVLKKISMPQWLGIIIALVPTITFASFIYQFIKEMAKMDEVESRIQLEATVWGFSLGLLMLMVLGCLDVVIVIDKKDWGYLFLVPYFILFYFIGLFISKRKYH